TKHAYFSHVVYFFDVDRSAGFALHFLNYFSSRSDNSTNEFAVDEHLHHSWCVRLHFGARFRNALVHCIEDVEPSATSLLERLLHHFHLQSIYLNVHLHAANTIACTGYFEVHITEVIFISKNVCENRVLFALRDQSHCHTRYVLRHWHTCVHQRKGSRADSGH